MWEDGPFLVQNGRIEQEDFLKKKKWKKKRERYFRGSLGDSPAASTPASSLSSYATLPRWCVRPQGERTLRRAWAHIQGTTESEHLGGPWAHIRGTGESAHHGRPLARTLSPEESACPNLQDQRLLGHLAGGWQSASQEWRRVKLSPPQPAAAKKTRKTSLASLKPAGGFSFLSNIFLLLIFSFNTFFLSFLLSCFIHSLFHFISPLPSSSSPFFLISASETIKPGTVKTRVGPKEGASQQLRQWDKFHFATTENMQVIVYFIIIFSLFLHLSFY